MIDPVKHRKVWQFIGLVIAWPVLAYLAIYHTLDIDEYSHGQGTAAALIVTGMAAWVALKVVETLKNR